VQGVRDGGGPEASLQAWGIVHNLSGEDWRGVSLSLIAEAPLAALVPDGRPGAGGSHVLAMRWVHDLDAFEALPIPEQENTFGRTKPESIELDDPRPDELLIRNEASGICHTDLLARGRVPLPAVLGHEGAGVVEAIVHA